MQQSSHKLRSGMTVELHFRLCLDVSRQSLHLSHETLDLLSRAVSPGQGQVERDRCTICNANKSVTIHRRRLTCERSVFCASLSHFLLLTLEELPAACSGSSSRQGQPHHSVCALLHAAQPLTHHLAEARHRCGHSWTQDKGISRGG